MVVLLREIISEDCRVEETERKEEEEKGAVRRRSGCLGMAAASALRRLSFPRSKILSYPLERLLSTGVFQKTATLRVQDFGFGD